MVIINADAELKLNNIFYRYLEEPSFEYGIRAIGWWYYQIKGIVSSLDSIIDNVKKNCSYSLNGWGELFFDSYIVNDEIIIVIIDFKFNLKAISNWVRFHKHPSDHLQKVPSRKILPLFTAPNHELLSSISIGYKVIKCVYKSGKMKLVWKGKNIELKHQFDSVKSVFRKRKGGEIYAICTKDGKDYKLFPDDTIEFYGNVDDENDRQLSEIISRYYKTLHTLIYS